MACLGPGVSVGSLCVNMGSPVATPGKPILPRGDTIKFTNLANE